MLEVDPADNMDFRYHVEMLTNEEGVYAGWELIETGKHGEQSLFRFNSEGMLIYHNRNAYDKAYEERHPASRGIYLQEEIFFDAEGIMTEWSRWGYYPDEDKAFRTRLDSDGKIIDSEYPREPKFKEGETVYLFYDTGQIEKAEAEISASGFVFIELKEAIRRRIWVPENCLFRTAEEAAAALTE